MWSASTRAARCSTDKAESLRRLHGVAGGLPGVETAAEGDGVLDSGVDREERRTGAGVLGGSGAVEDGLFAGGETTNGIGGRALDLIEWDEDGAGGPIGTE